MCSSAAMVVCMGLRLTVNGEVVIFEGDGLLLVDLLQQRQLRADRVAVERNGAIVGREAWASTQLEDGDRLEIVHFVGGGTRLSF